jgi:flagellar hook-length control protein FliK
MTAFAAAIFATSLRASHGHIAAAVGRTAPAGPADGTSATNLHGEAAAASDSAEDASSGRAASGPSGDLVAPSGAAPSSAPAGAPSAAAPAGVRYGTSLADAVETLRLTIAQGASNGVTLARIALSPPELGVIHVQLTQTDGGVIARVVADHATTAAVLQQADGELRQALEASGVQLLGLDIGASDQQAGGGGRASEDATNPLVPVPANSVEEEPTGGPAAEPRTVALANGALIDVLA